MASAGRTLVNFVLHKLARSLPGNMSVRPFLHKLRGVQIEGRVMIGDEVYIDNMYPQNVRLEDGATIAPRATIFAHGRGPGHVVLKTDCRIGACAVVCASPGKTLTIGEGAIVAAGAVVHESVAAHTLVGGVPAKPIALAEVPLSWRYSDEQFRSGLRPLVEDVAAPDPETES